MPKDPARNVDRYKIRGGQFNEFDFHRGQEDFAQQEHSRGQGPHGAEAATGLPPDQAKAERTRQLLAAHGESVPEPAASEQPTLLEEPEAPHPVHDIEGAKAKVAAARRAPTPRQSREETEAKAAARRASDKVPARANASTGRAAKSGSKQGGAGAKQASARAGAKAAPASKGAKQAAAQKSTKQSAKQPAAKKGAKQTATPARKSAGNKAGAGAASKAGRTATKQARSGSSGRRQR